MAKLPPETLVEKWKRFLDFCAKEIVELVIDSQNDPNIDKAHVFYVCFQLIHQQSLSDAILQRVSGWCDVNEHGK